VVCVKCNADDGRRAAFVVEVVANVSMHGAARYLVIGLCAGAMLACLWRLNVNNRSGKTQ
jgi:hypothetical protein